jgi:hypothetical protein
MSQISPPPSPPPGPPPPPAVTIGSIQSLPNSPYNGTAFVGICITSGVPNYYKLTGSNLNRIVSVRWFPENPASVLQESRNLILIDNTLGTFMIRVLNNYLDIEDRGGYISFKLDDGTTLSAPVKTYGRISLMPLWQAPGAGLITG